ncbi:MAG: Gfo/Idh/MocA family oxidoreductase, partial [Candidatus Omnitrophica bacterium]|nr:Gfo/Idh/MocA family oxidoreductase [Candidatus Omnitrophota bacterium]
LLAGPPIDAVLVCGPPDLHRSAGVAALRAGKPVFMEKPPAENLAGALEVREAARASGVICMVGFMKRFALRYREAKEIAAGPDFGALTHVFFKYSHWDMPTPHDMLMYMTVHPLDLMRFFLGEIERVTIDRVERGGQSAYTLVFRARGGAIGNLLTGAHQPRLKERLEVVGEGAFVAVNNLVELEYHRRVEARRHFTNDLGDIDLVRPDFAIPNLNQNTLFLQGYADELKEFASAVLEKRAPSVTIEDGVEAMRLMELMERTALHASYVRSGEEWVEG